MRHLSGLGGSYPVIYSHGLPVAGKSGTACLHNIIYLFLTLVITDTVLIHIQHHIHASRLYAWRRDSRAPRSHKRPSDSTVDVL